MTFRQTFSSFFVSNGTLSKQSLEKWSRKRKFCSIADLDPSFDTVKSRNSCAIIGNSGILLNSRCGREIDAHDVVLRANMAKVKGYANDVGNKTSVMMINGESLRHIYDILIATKDNTTNDYNNMLHYFQSLDDSLIWFAKGTGGRNYSIKLQSIATFFWKKGLKAKFGLSMLSAYRATSRRWKTKASPTSGLIILTIAETFCKHIDLYGFYPYQSDSSGAPVLHHYYEPNLTDFHTKAHDFDEEHKLLRRRSQEGLFRLVLEPCAT